MIIKYFSFSVSIVFVSFIVGMIITALIRKTNFYNKELSTLNFVKSEMINKIIGVGIVKWIVKWIVGGADHLIHSFRQLVTNLY